MAEPFTLYKLIILYMLDRVDFPLTNSQISSFLLDRGYTNFQNWKKPILLSHRPSAIPHSFS